MNEPEETGERGEVSQATRAPRSAAPADARTDRKPITAHSLPLAVRQEQWRRIWQILLTPRSRHDEGESTGP
jgi:hypothetical protein